MHTLLKIWRNLGPGNSGMNRLETTRSGRVFELWYQDLLVGKLKEAQEGWVFVYTHDFRKQDKVKALADFPQKSKSYQFEKLWPFFASRIPSLEQPKVQRQLRKENINAEDTGALLQRYGKRSITNSFVLKEGQ
jgi:HipA-like protein